MPKPDKNLVELKRQVRILLALDGRVLRTRAGVWLLQRGRVLDPVTLRKLLEAPQFERNQLRACMSTDSQCEPLSRQHLAAATHALAMLDAHCALLFDTPARWLGGARRDANWLIATRSRVQRLSGYLNSAIDPSTEEGQAAALTAWFAVDQIARWQFDERTQQLAWLCDSWTELPSPNPLMQLSAAAWQQALVRVAEHGPRESGAAVSLIAATQLWDGSAIDAWWPWLVAGISPADVESWPQTKQLRANAAPPPDWPLAAVRIYVRFSTLLRHKSAGLDIQPQNFARLAQARKPTLVVLAAVLDQMLRSGARGNAEQSLVWTDTVLRLHGKLSVPTQVPITISGADRDAAFAIWMADGALLDRYLSLRHLLGETPDVSLRLRADYERVATTTRQREYLNALPADDPRRAQLARLAKSADPSRTRSKMAEDCTRLELRWRLAQADQVLRDTLSRVIGAQLPAIANGADADWNIAWRDAARLYLAVDQNHTELKLLLRAAATGTAHTLRQQLPANAKWWQAAADHLNVEAWADPPTHAFSLRDATCTLAAEPEPLQALRMGVPFDSCLALDDGCNRHSAIINALDANKWVVYLRDGQQRILARQLLCISSDWKLLGYRIYTSIGASTQLTHAFVHYAQSLAQACGLQMADHGEPETLNGVNWYDDGCKAWPPADVGQQSTLLGAYGTELGLLFTEDADDELLDEARRWSLARAGHTAALHSWADSRPSNQRNQSLLEQRYGWPTLCRLLGDNLIRDHYRQGRLREAPLAEILRAQRSFHDVNHYRPGHDLIENAVHLPALKLLLREVLSTPGEVRFDDDGLEHAMLSWLPRWAEGVSLADLSRALSQLAAAFARLRCGLPEDCAHCVNVGEQSMLFILRRAWRRAPDPQLVLRLLNARHDSDTLPRWLLSLAAREHLQQPAALPAFDAPRYCRASLRALHHLASRFPALRDEPTFFAAVLRHSDPQTLDFNTLSWPTSAPWAALGDAIVHWPQLWLQLRRYARAPGDVSSCSATEAFWHRRVDTAWRQELPERVAAFDEHSEAAARCLAQIGLAELLDEAQTGLRRKAYGAKRHPERYARIRSLLKAAGEDPLTRMQTAWKSLQSPGLNWEREVDCLAQHPQALDIADALIDLADAPNWARSFLQQVLPNSRNRERYRRLHAHSQFADLADLCAPYIWSGSSARRLLQTYPESLAERFLIGHLRAGNEDLIDDGPPDWYQRLAILARDVCSPDVWLKLFQALPDALAASIFIHALEPEKRSALRANLPATDGKLAWLGHCKVRSDVANALHDPES